MPADYEIHWLPDGPIEEFRGSRGNYYEFSESDHIDLQAVPVWCRRCARITEGEELLTTEELDRLINDLQDTSTEIYKFTRHGVLEELLGKGEEHVQECIIDLQRRRQWRESRVSPAKCIQCGSTDIVFFRLDEPMPSPRGRGEVQIQIVGMCSTSFNEWFFTPEGDRIPRDTQSTYWSHPDPRLKQSLAPGAVSDLWKSMENDGPQTD
jgi:hypothetical protein